MGEIISKSQNSLNTQNWAQHGTVFLKLKKQKKSFRSERKFEIPQLPLLFSCFERKWIELGCTETTVVGSVLLGIKIYCRAH